MAKNSATKGAKKSRRFGKHNRTDVQVKASKARKAARREAQDAREKFYKAADVNSLWELAKRKRFAKRHP